MTKVWNWSFHTKIYNFAVRQARKLSENCRFPASSGRVKSIRAEENNKLVGGNRRGMYSIFLYSRVTGACPVTTDLIMRVNVKTTTQVVPVAARSLPDADHD